VPWNGCNYGAMASDGCDMHARGPATVSVIPSEVEGSRGATGRFNYGVVLALKRSFRLA